MAIGHKIGEPVPIPEEIDVLEKDGKTIHTLSIQLSLDVTEYKDRPEIIQATHITMAQAIKTQASLLEKKWTEGQI